jgi:NADH:ubiquinone oxidoreductase subunit E
MNMMEQGSDLVATWDPNVPGSDDAFAALYAKLRPECDALVALYEDSRSALLPMAHLFQEHEGYTSPNALRAIAYVLDLPLSVIESTVSFYTLFYRKPVGKYMLQVCRNLSCIINGAEEIMAYFRAQLGINHLETTYDVKPNPQTKAPGKTWKIEQGTGRKSAGGVGVSNPDNAGGIGDRSGVIMLDRIVNDIQFAQRSHERLAHEPQLRPSTNDGGHH